MAILFRGQNVRWFKWTKTEDQDLVSLTTWTRTLAFAMIWQCFGRHCATRTVYVSRQLSTPFTPFERHNIKRRSNGVNGVDVVRLWNSRLWVVSIRNQTVSIWDSANCTACAFASVLFQLWFFSFSYSCDLSVTVTVIVFQFLFLFQLVILHKICISAWK